MAYLGYANPLHRISRAIWGWYMPPPAGRPLPHDFYLIGHRGAAMFAPENTIVAFAKAVELGANAIETDVCITQDDCFILWHDADPNDAIALARQFGGEGLLYMPEVPTLVSPWRRPVSKLALSTLQTYCGYIRCQPGYTDGTDGEPPAPVSPAVFEELIAWLRYERRVRHVFLDLKLAPPQADAAIALLHRLHRLALDKAFRQDLLFHILSPHLEIVAALLAEARRVPLPPTLRLWADFELPGVCQVARQLGVRHVCMGCGVRAWGEFRHEVAQAVAERDHGHFDTVVVWTVNDEARLQELVALGVNGVITDTPALLHRLVREHRRRGAGMVPQVHAPVHDLVGQVAHPWVTGKAS
jgi:glycerophosphoryl diester phosphodiesterase